MTQTEVGNSIVVAYYPSVHSHTYNSMQSLRERGKMRGVQRVVTFCLLTAVLPTILLIIPLYLRHNTFADVTYAVAESDVLEISDGISSIFCQDHSLRMNSTFHAFQVKSLQSSNSRKHIRLQKKMLLPDDTLEYYGFYLLKGSTVILSLCSRFQGASVLVVEGERNLRTCGIKQHSDSQVASHVTNGHGQVRVSFDANAKEIYPNAQQNEKTEYNANGSNEETVPNDQFEGEDTVQDDIEENARYLQNYSETFIKKHGLGSINSVNEPPTNDSRPILDNVVPIHSRTTRRIRHAKTRLSDLKKHSVNSTEVDSVKALSRKKRIKKLEDSLNEHTVDGNILNRRKRNLIKEGHILDAKVGHGHAGNESKHDQTDESSVSSFEDSLFKCYEGKVLLAQSFPPSDLCSSAQVLNSSRIMQTTHEVESDGYYYYIFYSDNDLVDNNIHAVFNIFKTTYQYGNHTNGCINKTECTFPILFWSDETVVVEVPTRDGIGDEEDSSFLISSCHPRMSVYIIFPISVLFLILGCAFL